MFGGANDDFYFVDNSGDTANESAAQGFDVVWTSISYALAAGSEIEALSAISWEATTALTLVGNELGNALYGNAGSNVLNGRGGNDTMVGFGGADSFLFDSALGGNVDTIADFSSIDDTIVLDDSVFATLSTGTLNANAFFVGAAAHDADDRIIYDSATGALYYDADGNGAGAAIQFAILQGAPPINSSDFQVI
jgi:Ca2+-binding RTX toxin-like protein